MCLKFIKKLLFSLHNKKAAAEADDLRKSSADFSGRQKDSAYFLKSFFNRSGRKKS
jgi:hypothetical protein